MKVSLDQFGNMTISGENSIEVYALRKFWDDWRAHKVSLGVEIKSDNGIAEMKPIRSEP